MDAVEFLKTVWPTEGFYCIARLIKPPGKKPYFKHESFSSIEAAAAYAVTAAAKLDVYFTIHTLVKDKVWNSEKNYWQYRTHANMKACRCFFADLDVGSDKGYETLEQAIAALEAFLKATGLPRPWVLSSGVGAHLFWPLTEALDTATWKKQALLWRKVLGHHALQVDPTRIDDQSSVLRIPGTKHHKDPKNVKPVEMAFVGKVTPTKDFLVALGNASLAIPMSGEESAAVARPLAHREYVPMPAVVEACAVMRDFVDNAATQAEPVWYQTLNVMRFVEDGITLAHTISSKHANYSRAETEKKLDQLETIHTVDGKPLGPSTCAKLGEVTGGALCAKCWYAGHPHSSPVVAARMLPRETSAEEIKPPWPFSRTKEGTIAMDQGEDRGLLSILEYDLYPSDLIDDETGEQKSIVWSTVLPLRGSTNFTIAASSVYDQKELSKVLSNAGVFFQIDKIKHVRNYMQAFMAELQRYAKDKAQRSHLGWSDDNKSFVLPDVTISKSGTTRSFVGENIRTSAAAIRRKGSEKRQVELLDFYRDPAYVRQQFLISCSLGAILYRMTDLHGTIINASGETGASKSTALYAGAGFWGKPHEYAISGLDSGATAKLRNHLMTMLANLPVMVDEITLMSREDAKQMAMSVTQGQGRRGLMQNGSERRQVAAERSTLMICTANNSLHDLLSANNAAGTAGSMRVVEVVCRRLAVHQKPEADDLLHELGLNYGHIGPTFAEYVVRNEESVLESVLALRRSIDTQISAGGHERFWTASFTVALMACMIGRQMGLLPFDPHYMRRWMLGEQIQMMRSTIGASYADPIETLVSYIGSIAPDILMVRRSGAEHVVMSKPRGELSARLELDNNMIYLAQHTFKDFCLRTGTPFNAIMASFEQAGYAKRERITLGRGTDLSFGQVASIAVNLNHVAISGTAELTTDAISRKILPFPQRS